MAERSITSLYLLLIDRAELIMTRAGLGQERELVELSDEIEAAVRKPAEERLIFDEEKLLAQCLLRILAARDAADNDRGRLWLQIAGVLLPVVREHSWLATVAHRRNTVPTTDQDYTPKR